MTEIVNNKPSLFSNNNYMKLINAAPFSRAIRSALPQMYHGEGQFEHPHPEGFAN